MTPNLSSPTDCASCPIRHRAVCSRCDDTELAQLENIKYYRNFEAGQTIVWAGDEMNFVASVVRGTATLSQTMEDGRTQMVGLLLPSDFLGRPGRSNSPFDVTAVSDITLCCFRRKPFEALMKTTPHVAAQLLTITLDELDAAREWMLILGRKTAREKIASLLAIIAKRESHESVERKTQDVTITLPLTREATANYLGLTLETVSRQISALKSDGVIILNGNREILVPEMAALITQSGGEMDIDAV